MNLRAIPILACLTLAATPLSAEDVTIANARIIVANGTVIYGSSTINLLSSRQSGR